MGADYRVHVYAAEGDRHALLRGVPRDLLRDLGISAQWSAVQRGFLIRSERVTDVVAMLEYANAVVRYHATAAGVA